MHEIQSGKRHMPLVKESCGSSKFVEENVSVEKEFQNQANNLYY